MQFNVHSVAGCRLLAAASVDLPEHTDQYNL